MSILWTANQIVKATQGQVIGHDDWAATGMAMDSREVNPGDIFIAIDGSTMEGQLRTAGGDGHDYIANAIENGAIVAIVHKDMQADIPLIRVEDTYQAMVMMAEFARKNAALKQSIAITGSVGKTTVRDMTATAFRGCDANTHASIKSYNNKLGVPFTLGKMSADTDIGVFEIGMNHGGEITPLSNMVKPGIAIITSIAAQHIENFDNEMDGIVAAKSEVFAGIQNGGMAILPGDNEYYDDLVRNAKQAGVETIVTFGSGENADSKLLHFNHDENGLHIQADMMGQPIDYTLQLMGAHQAMNSVVALTAVKLAGYDIVAAAKALGQIEALEGRGRQHQITIRQGQPPITLIDDSYNAAPAAVAAGLAVLGQIQPKGQGRRIAMLGQMAELGDRKAELHANLAKPFVQAGVDALYCCGPDMQNLYNAIPEGNRGEWVENSQILAGKVADIIQPGDVVLVKGSLGSAMRHVVDAVLALQIG